jgi:hypothetical protein
MSENSQAAEDVRPGSVTLVITSAEGLVGRIEDYRGPIPRRDEYIFHPPLDDDGTSDISVHAGVMSVKSVTYGILTRPQHGEKHFTGRPVQVVEVWV